MSATTIQCLLEITPHGSASPLRYQNYQIEDLFFDTRAFEYAPFSFDTYPQQTLELSDDSATITIRNNEVVRSLLAQNDGLRRAVVEAWHIEVGTANPPWHWILQVMSSEPRNGTVVFNLRSPTTALTGPLVTRFFSSDEFPELPVYQVQL